MYNNIRQYMERHTSKSRGIVDLTFVFFHDCHVLIFIVSMSSDLIPTTTKDAY